MVIAAKFVRSEPGVRHGRCVSMFQRKLGWLGGEPQQRRKRKSHAASRGASAELVLSSGPGERSRMLSSWDTQ